MNNLLGSYFSFGHLPLGLGTVVIRVRSRILSLVRLVLAAVRGGEGWGVEGGGRLLEWIKLRHRTRVTVLKLSFNGRQCQKLSLSIPLVFVSLSSEQFDAHMSISIMVSRRIRSTISARLTALNCLE